jgi:hypothetical protein
MPDNFEIHQHGTRYWFTVHEPDSWALVIASPAIHDTPAAAVTAAVLECRNLARVCRRHGYEMQGVSAL